MTPSADQFALALVIACRSADIEPEHVFAPGPLSARARTVAGMGLVEAGLASRAIAAKVLGFASGSSMSPSRRVDLRIRHEETQTVAGALRARGYRAALVAPLPKSPAWTDAEDEIVREAIRRRWHDTVTLEKLRGRSRDALKKRRQIIGKQAESQPAPAASTVETTPAKPPRVVSIRPVLAAPTEVFHNHAPRCGGASSHLFPHGLPRSLQTDSISLADRIVAHLGNGPQTKAWLAALCDAKELWVGQALAMLEHDGFVMPGPIPPEGRRDQKWSLTAKALVA